MAAPGRRTDPSLEEALFERGYEFEFFQAVRLLARIYPQRKPVGGTANRARRLSVLARGFPWRFRRARCTISSAMPDSPRARPHDRGISRPHRHAGRSAVCITPNG